MMQITKAAWNLIPSNQKKTHKDGTRLVQLVRDGAKEWVKVYWKS